MQSSDKDPLLKEKIPDEGQSSSETLVKEKIPGKGQSSSELKPKEKSSAKKKAAFLDREVVIHNPEDVDNMALLNTLLERFTNNYWKWQKRAKLFKGANLSVTILLIVIQLVQVSIFQVTTLDANTKSTIATILPAVTGAVLAVQQKLKWSEKADKAKKSATLCNKFRSQAQYRLDVVEAGGRLDDSVKLWNVSMRMETTELPAFLMAY